MLDDADSAEPLRGDSAKRIRPASPVQLRFVNVFDLLAPVRRASSSIVVRVVRALHLTEVGLAVVPWRRRFPRAALARKASTRRQEAASGVAVLAESHPSTLGWRRGMRQSTFMRGHAKGEPWTTQVKLMHTVVQHFVSGVVRTPIATASGIGFVSPKCFQTRRLVGSRAYRIASRLKALRLTHRASFEPNSEVRRRRRRRLAATGALPRRWRGSGSRLRRRHECRRP